MTHKIAQKVVKRFLQKAQAWIDKTPGAISIAMPIGGKDIILAQKTSREKTKNE